MTKLEKVIKGLELLKQRLILQADVLGYGEHISDIDNALELLKAKDINVTTKWISVKDRLPDAAGYKCLVMAINKFGQKSVFTAHTGYGDFEWYTTDVIYMNKVNRNTVSDAWTITHWTPLPEPPKEDKDDDE